MVIIIFSDRHWLWIMAGRAMVCLADVGWSFFYAWLVRETTVLTVLMVKALPRGDAGFADAGAGSIPGRCG